MVRFTKSDLIAEIEELNLKLSHTEYSFKYQHRNGYHAVDLMKNGDCVRCVDCAEPPRILSEKCWDEYYYLIGDMSHI